MFSSGSELVFVTYGYFGGAGQRTRRPRKACALKVAVAQTVIGIAAPHSLIHRSFGFQNSVKHFLQKKCHPVSLHVTSCHFLSPSTWPNRGCRKNPCYNAAMKRNRSVCSRRRKEAHFPPSSFGLHSNPQRATWRLCAFALNQAAPHLETCTKLVHLLYKRVGGSYKFSKTDGF
jgi:hypothetical protein